MQTYPNAAAFLNRTQSFFQAHEAENHSILGMTLRMRDRSEPPSGQPYLATFETAAGDLILAAAMKSQQNLVLSGAGDLPQPVLDELCAHLNTHGWSVTGVLAVDELAQRFAGTWQRMTGHTYSQNMHMRAYEVRRVIPPAQPPAGCMRLVTLADMDLLTPWRVEFQVESLHEAPPENLRELVAREIDAGAVYVWEDGQPVSTAACTRPTLTGIWVHAVYTPPACRGRGYASALVAELSQQLLDAGKSYVGLYTDVEYPTSNAIYQHIGYRPVRDFTVYQFH
jgi:uncharacterized protein